MGRPSSPHTSPIAKLMAWYISWSVSAVMDFWRRVSKHVYSMEIGNRYLPIGRHVVLEHNHKVPKVSFTALDQIHIPDRGGDWNKILLQHEQRWIFKLQAMTFPGLNESISFAPFLRGFASGKTQ